MTDDEIDLIYKINRELELIIDKFGKEKLLYAAKWLFSPSVISKRMILHDDKGWEKLIEINVEDTFPLTHRLRKYPNLCKITSLDNSNIPRQMICLDVEFTRNKHEFIKRECGCVDEIMHYKQR